MHPRESLWLFLLIYVGSVFGGKLRTGNGHVEVHEVPHGNNTVLKCNSNDNDHNFLFWLLASNDVVGPGNEFYNINKYKYEVLTGNLTIRHVSTREQGLYNCFSQGVNNNDINIRTVRMIVKKEWEDVYEHDPSVNLFRTVLALGSIAIVIGVAYLGYSIYKNRLRNPRYLEASDEEEDSAEELFSAPGPSKSSASIVIDPPQEQPKDLFPSDVFPRDVFDSPGISTDFGSFLDSHK